MKYNIIQTDNYLIIVDDSEIKEGDLCIANSATYNNAIVKYMKSPCPPPYVSNLLILKKIIAHLPLTISPVLEGVELLPPLEDDDCDSLQMYVESLSQKKYPITFECEMEQLNNKPGSSYEMVTRYKPKTTSNSQGQTILVGKYIY